MCAGCALFNYGSSGNVHDDVVVNLRVVVAPRNHSRVTGTNNYSAGTAACVLEDEIVRNGYLRCTMPHLDAAAVDVVDDVVLNHATVRRVINALRATQRV